MQHPPSSDSTGVYTLYILYIYLSFQHYAYAADFAAKRGCELCNATLYLRNLWELLLHGVDDILCHAFDGAALDAHHIADNLINGKVVYGLLHCVLVGHNAQIGCDGKLHNEAVAHNLLQVVAAVVGAELHLLQAYSVKHISGYISGASRSPPQCFTQR